MKPKRPVTLILGLILVILGILTFSKGSTLGGIIFVLIGSSLCYLSWFKNRVSLLVFGHTCIIVGCILITWGIYLLPYSEPKLTHVFFRPLFWGLFSLFGGICANYHAFCSCIHKQIN